MDCDGGPDRAGGRSEPVRAVSGHRGRRGARAAAGHADHDDRAGYRAGLALRASAKCHRWCQHVAVRPALKAGLLPVRRDRDTLQFGGGFAAGDGAGRARQAAVISLLDGAGTGTA